MKLICEYLLTKEINKPNDQDNLTDQEKCWLEACERELILLEQLKLDEISYYGCSREEYVEKIKTNNYSVVQRCSRRV